MDYLKLPLSDPIPLQDAFSTWQGFVELSPEEPTIGPNRIFELDDRADSEWTYDFHWKPPADRVEATGCNFVRDIELWAPSIAVHAGQLVGYGAVADFDNWRAAPAFKQGGFFDVPAPVDRIIDRPMLIADGVTYSTWGHWIIDFLPRFAIARALLGPKFDDLTIPLPFDAPDWITDLLETTCSVRTSNIVRYRPYSERLICAHAVIPSYSYSGIHTFHSFLKQFYQRLQPANILPRSRLCISRGGIAHTGSNRQFPLRARFEDLAENRGYQIVRPETLSLSDQIALFANAAVVIGEHGSAMHNSVFCAPDTIIGCIGFWNAVQLQLGYVCHHRNVYLTRGCAWPSDEDSSFRLGVTEDDLVSFLDKIDDLIDGRTATSHAQLQVMLTPENPGEYADLPALGIHQTNGVTSEKLSDQIEAIPTSPAFNFGPIDRIYGQAYYQQRLCLEVGVYRVDQGCIFGDGLVARHGKLLRRTELGLYDDAISHLRSPFQNRELRIRQESGTCVAIAGVAHQIYGHWLIDHLPKLWVLQSSGIDIGKVRFLLPTTLEPFAKEWLTLLGIRDEQLVFYDFDSEAVEAEELILPTLMRFESVASPLLRQAAGMLLDRVFAHGGLQVDDQGKRPERFYISRGGIHARPLRNRVAIEERAATAGFAIVRPEEMPITEQIALFRGAKQIVGEYGSGLHNSLFSKPGTVIAALRGSDLEPWYLQSGIGRALDQPTGYVFGRNDPEDPMMGYTVDPDDFSDCLRLILQP